MTWIGLTGLGYVLIAVGTVMILAGLLGALLDRRTR